MALLLGFHKCKGIMHQQWMMSRTNFVSKTLFFGFNGKVGFPHLLGNDADNLINVFISFTCDLCIFMSI